jgi:hypothetical protein
MANEQNQTDTEDLGDLSGFQTTGEDFSVRNRKKAKRQDDPGPLAITSLMDILTVLLLFLIKSYSATPVNITMSDDLTLPDSSAQIPPEDAVPIAITARQILVADKPVANIHDGKVDPDQKDGEESYLIRGVRDALAEEAEHQRRIATYNQAQEFTGTALVIAHRETPFRLLSEVLYSAGQAEFAQFRFTVIKRE